MVELNYNGYIITQREQDNYVNLTSMAQANGVNINDWKKTKSTDAYLLALASNTNIIVDDLLLVKSGGKDTLDRGTWAHPLVALNFAQWISPNFHVWCNIHIKTLMETGSTKLVMDKPLTNLQMFAMAVKSMEEQEARINNIEVVQQSHSKVLEKVDAHLPELGYTTISAWANLRKFNLQNGVGQMLAVRCRAFANRDSIELKYITDTYRGNVPTYPISLLDNTFNYLITQDLICQEKKRTLTWIFKNVV